MTEASASVCLILATALHFSKIQSTDFISFIERTKVPENTILVSMDVKSFYNNIPQEKGIQTVCEAYDTFYEDHVNLHKHSG